MNYLFTTLYAMAPILFAAGVLSGDWTESTVEDREIVIQDPELDLIFESIPRSYRLPFRQSRDYLPGYLQIGYSGAIDPRFTETRSGAVSNSPQLVSALFPQQLINTHTGEGVAEWPAGVWNTVDLGWLLPHDAKVVELSVLMIGTQGFYQGTVNMTLTVRKPGTDEVLCGIPGHYDGQVVGTATANSIRSPYKTKVPLEDGVFEMCWTHNLPSFNWPTTAALGINIAVAGWEK